MPNIEYLQSLFDYDSETGVLTWKVQRGRGRPGKAAGRTDRDGYLRVEVDGRTQSVARIAYTIYTGRDPFPLTIDHVNRVRTDNRIVNLRPATPSEQNRNRVCPYRDPVTGETALITAEQAKERGWVGPRTGTTQLKTPCQHCRKEIGAGGLSQHEQSCVHRKGSWNWFTQRLKELSGSGRY